MDEKLILIDQREGDINRIKKILEEKDQENMHITTQLNMATDQVENVNQEMEMKSSENNRLRRQVVDLEKAMKDLYCSRKGNGSLQIELDSLKADNERLLGLLKATTEYADMDDSEIVKAANALKGKISGLGRKSNKNSGTKSKTSLKSTQPNNDWIPTEAVRAILEIADKPENTITETSIAAILYKLNTIWRNIMRKENDAIKKRLTAQIQDLKR